MKRIILHWTAGTYTPNATDLAAYHFVIDGTGNVHPGKWPVSANEKPQTGRYAAHTLNCNTGSIGVSLAAMAGAQERPYKSGNYPITDNQMRALAALAAKLCKEYGIKVTRETVLTHAEVQPTLGIAQKNKWDITVIPELTKPGDPVAVGDRIREMISYALDGIKPVSKPVDNKIGGNPAVKGLFAALWRFFTGGKA